MTPDLMLMLIVVAATAYLAVRARLTRDAPDFAPASLHVAPAIRRSAPNVSPRVATAPGLPMVEWTDPVAGPSGADLRDRIRDRYVSARFPNIFRRCSDLEDTRRVITAARLYFEEDRLDHAHELLDLAIIQSPEDGRLRLAQLEIAFLERNPERFTAHALAYREKHPKAREWEQVARLGNVIAPSEPLFGGVTYLATHAHYGPWPEMPNWIEASWDLTSELLAADFHRAMTRPSTSRSALLRAA